jgi:uncharacterized membrane protein YqaE (UPF0057 family)
LQRMRFHDKFRVTGVAEAANQAIQMSCSTRSFSRGGEMSLQAIAGVAYDRRNPKSPSSIARLRVATETAQATPPEQVEVHAGAKQVNGALEALKRYIPTEFLALYLPFLAIAKDRGAGAADWSIQIYIGFIIATPFAVFLIFVAKAAESGGERSWSKLPFFESTLATASFAIWGACVPSMFPGNQYWLAMLAMASAFVLPLIDTAFGKSKAA